MRQVDEGMGDRSENIGRCKQVKQAVIYGTLALALTSKPSLLFLSSCWRRQGCTRTRVSRQPNIATIAEGVERLDP